VLLYPTSEDLAQARSGREWLHERAWLEGLAQRQALIVIDLAREPAWQAGLYRDGVHPTAAGNAILADILSASLRAALPECR
ncbi:MAG TPA: hypothetical protein VMU47_09620, partial [Caldimonas sp.]|nr:hypothetical protein [Caldimonas sp.]